MPNWKDGIVIIVYGNSDGLGYIGPFPNYKTALEWGNENDAGIDGAWWVTRLQAPWSEDEDEDIEG